MAISRITGLGAVARFVDGAAIRADGVNPRHVGSVAIRNENGPRSAVVASSTPAAPPPPCALPRRRVDDGSRR